MPEPPTSGVHVLRLPRDLSGRAEKVLTPVFQEALESSADFIVVDFGDVKRCDSAGIGLFVGLLQRARAQDIRLALAAVSGQPLLVLGHVRLLDHLSVFDTVEEAVASAAAEE